jgi:uncharacterized LabA/DUF88 family protein
MGQTWASGNAAWAGSDTLPSLQGSSIAAEHRVIDASPMSRACLRGHQPRWPGRKLRRPTLRRGEGRDLGDFGARGLDGGLIEIPHVRQSGKNSADIRMVVDALDLRYTKEHIDTFVIISGDSDFSTTGEQTSGERQGGDRHRRERLYVEPPDEQLR